MTYITWIFLSLIALILSCSTTEPPPAATEIIWDQWGVPHIYAQNQEELYFSAGYAQMHLHGNLILELYGRSRGQGAEYWGEDYLETDMLIHTLGFPELAREWTDNQDPELQRIIASFVKGLNAYAEAHPEALDEDKKVVLPIEPADVNLHSMFVVYTSFVGGSELGRVSQWEDKGSNTYAIAASRSASGNSMLVQNPHLPWWDEYLFVEMHYNTGDYNLYGATLVGFPVIALGFSDHLGWSHTDNTIDNADTYELELSGDGYLLDNEETPFESKTKTINVKDNQGKMGSQEITVLKSAHGPVVKMGASKALAVRMVGYNRPNSMLQWVRMGKSTNFDEFEEALRLAQIPFWNVMYADRQDNIFYLFNGQVPVRSNGGWDYWNNIINGGKSSDIWTQVHPYEDLPKVKNPTSGWLQNSNDPPWTCTYPLALNPNDFPPYMAPRGMSFRPQQSAIMLHNDQSITFEELRDYKLSTRMSLADRILDDLFSAVDQYGGALAQEAKKVLESWDRQANNHSVGTVLFTQWVREARLRGPQAFSKPWDQQDPLATPDGLSDPQSAVSALEKAAQSLMDNGGRLDVSWGEVYRINYHDIDLPGNGAAGNFGVVRVAWPRSFENGQYKIGGGDSWVSIIEFGEKVKANVLLSYGNSTQEGSRHRGDQLQLFSDKKMRDALYYREDVEKNVQRIEVLHEGVFRNEQK